MGDLQDAADRLDPMLLAVPMHEGHTSLQSAVELPLGKKRASSLQDLVGTAQLAHLTFEVFDAPSLRDNKNIYLIWGAPYLSTLPMLTKCAGNGA